MAGILPGVKCARRRKLHQGGAAAEPPIGSRRSSFCLYPGNHESHSTSNSMKRSTGVYNSNSGTVLGGIAREAKERLDEKLRTQRKDHNMGSSDGHELEVMGRLQREVFCWKRKRSWTMTMISIIRWKAKVEEKEECVVCLEELRTGEVVVKLPCAHRFHWSCVVPWLRGSSSCPYCRTQIKS